MVREERDEFRATATKKLVRGDRDEFSQAHAVQGARKAQGEREDRVDRVDRVDREEY